MLNKMNRMNRVERKRMVKGKQWMVLSTTALALGMVAFGGTEASAHEYTPATWEARMPNEIQITDRSNYLIIWGDTLWAISEASGVSVDALVNINNIADRDLIFAGNTLVIDGNVVTVTEKSGEKSSFVVEQDNVTKTDKHAEADKTVAVVTNEVENNVNTNTDTVKEEAVTEKDADAKPVEGSADEDGGNFTVVVNEDETINDEVPVVETPADETPAIETPADETPVVETPADEEDGGNFAPVVEEPVVNEDETVSDNVDDIIVEEPVVEEPVVNEDETVSDNVDDIVVEEPVTPIASKEEMNEIFFDEIDALFGETAIHFEYDLSYDGEPYDVAVNYDYEQTDYTTEGTIVFESREEAKAVGEELSAYLDSKGYDYYHMEGVTRDGFSIDIY